MPWTDWQFWIVTLAALLAALAVVRPLLPARGKRTACPGCGPEPDRSDGRRATLTIDGKPAPPSRARRG